MERMRLETGSDGIAVLWLCRSVMDSDFELELRTVIDRVESDVSLRGMIIAGAAEQAFQLEIPPESLLVPRDAREVYRQALARSQLVRRLETLAKPTVAVIDGSAAGAGFELALACQRRLITPDGAVSFPEMPMGLLPCAGATQRLPRMLGIPAALRVLQSGSAIDAANALAQGLVDGVTPGERLMDEARAWIVSAVATPRPWDTKGFRIPGGAGCMATHATESFQAGTSRMIRSTQRNYPAPLALLSAVFEGTQVPLDTALELEAKFYAALVTEETTRNLIRTGVVHRRAADRLVRRPADVPAKRFSRIGVIGAGLMGAGIAQVAARSGLNVVLLDQTPERAQAGRHSIARRLAREVKVARILAEDAEEQLSRIEGGTDLNALRGCDLVIEAVFEDAALKRAVLTDAEAVVGPHAILASNTSTLSISTLARACRHPGRVIGLHFFSPVERMPMLEIVRARSTSPQTLAQALDLARQLRKTPIVVGDSPGFFTSRVFGTYVDEGMAMLMEGVSPALIENAARMAGMPVGPLAVCDEVSIELQQHVHLAAVAAGLPRRFQRLTALRVVEEMLRHGRAGRRAGGGFYEYPETGRKFLWPGLGRIFPVAYTQPAVDEVRMRLLAVQSMEAMRCLEEGVIQNPSDADLGSVLAIGFPPWTGGVISYIDTIGFDNFMSSCTRLARRHGHRFRPTAGLRERVLRGRHRVTTHDVLES